MLSMEKFIEWFGRHRKTIGYTAGGVNLGAGIAAIAGGSVWPGILWLVLGAAIILDARMFK
jgi:hypothetical protein